jgi:hypothetical protein
MKRWLFYVGLILMLVLGTSVSLALAQGGKLSEEEASAIPKEMGVPPGPMAGEGALGVAAAFSGGADYDSGWIPLAPDQAKTLIHNLGGHTDNYLVDMQFRALGGDGINHRYYGGADFGANPAPGHNPDDRVGAYWRSLTDTEITIYRRPQDTYAEEVRIRIWIDSTPDWDSGWIALPAGGPASTLAHNLGGNADDYVVDMQYRDAGSGVNQRYFSGIDFGANPAPGHSVDDRVGVYWRSLTDTEITLFRREEDDYAEETRIRIWVRPNPTYDSGWVAIDQDAAQALAHNIGGSAEDYVVDMQFRSAGNGVNQRYYGGVDFGANPPSGMNENDRVGAYWRSLTNTSITIYRRPQDIYAPEIRVRIWNPWKPPTPNYDSGWMSIEAGENALVMNHNLGGSADTYLVDLQYLGDSANGINQRYYGGADFGAVPAPDHHVDDRVGAYWRSLTNTSITVYRRPEDTYAAQVRVRIWVMPLPDYESGWTAIATDASHTFAHNLGGSTNDYLVDLQFQDAGTDGVNQRCYGGMDFGVHPPLGAAEDDRCGAYWRSLDVDSIVVYRRPEDIYADQVRVRIWRVAKPDYDSGWVAIAQDETRTLVHNLGGAEQAYLLTMLQYDDSAANHFNQRHYGGADFGVNPPTDYNADDRVGSYWRSLTDSSVTVYRRPQDEFANWVRIRIWNYTQSIYLPIVLK